MAAASFTEHLALVFMEKGSLFFSVTFFFFSILALETCGGVCNIIYGTAVPCAQVNNVRVV